MDLFEKEQKILDDAYRYSLELSKGVTCDPARFHSLVREYDILLAQLRSMGTTADKITGGLVEEKQVLTQKVNRDALTGIYNRRFLEENVNRVIKSLSRSGGKLSVLMLDIDFFKKYNDTYGHGEGDNCLKKVAAAISGCLKRADDFVARYGGEEFTVVLPNTGEEGARLKADEILASVRHLSIPHKENDAADCVTVSIGVTTGMPDYTQIFEAFTVCADRALYESKNSGRNKYTFLDFDNT